MKQLNCDGCADDHFCCKFKVRLGWFDVLRIRGKGFKDFWEEDGFKEKTIKLVRGRCYFLDDEGCKIYSVRPKVCRKFPFIYPGVRGCGELHKDWKKHQKMVKGLIKK